MNWIILIIAGLFEVGFTFCLGKIKGATGADFYLWGAGVCNLCNIKYVPVGKGCANITHRHCISCLDGNRGSGNRIGRYSVFP